MFDFFAKFDLVPKSAKIGVIFLLVSWCWFYLSMYYLFLAQDIPTRLLLVGPMICLAVISLANWARILCLASNAMVILWFVLFAYVFFHSSQIKFFAAIVNVTLFGITSYYLAIKETSGFFKTYRKAAGSDEQADSGNKR